MYPHEQVKNLRFLVTFMKQGESLTYEQIAEKIGIKSPLTIQNLFKGKTQKPRVTTINLFRQYFNIPPETFGLPYSEFKKQMNQKWGASDNTQTDEGLPDLSTRLNGSANHLQQVLSENNMTMSDFAAMFNLDLNTLTEDHLRDPRFVKSFQDIFNTTPYPPESKSKTPNIKEQQVAQMLEILKGDFNKIIKTAMTTDSEGHLTLCVTFKE